MKTSEFAKKKLSAAIGVDLGGTKIALGVVDENGHILEHVRLKTKVDEGAEGVENQITEAIRELLNRTVLHEIIGIGIGVAGQIDLKTGEVIFAPNLKWHHIPLKSNLEKALDLPVCVINDVRAITWGEWIFGAGKMCSDLLCVFIGTGIGSGVVSGGRLLIGNSNIFGEVGHMTVDFNGPICTCGKKGCLEAFAGGWGIAERSKEALKKCTLTSSMEFHNVETLTTKEVIKAYFQKDPIAIQVIEEMKKALIAGMASLINIYNPQRLILGGGVVDGMPELVEIVEKGIRHDSLKAATQSFEVVRAKLGENVGVIGSAANVLKQIKKVDK